MGRVDSTLELPTGLHDLPTGIVDRRTAMETGSHQRELVSDLCMLWEDLRKKHSGGFGRDRFEWTSNFGGCIGFDIEGIDVARCTEVKDHDRRAFGFGRIDSMGIGSSQVLRQT